MPKVWLIIALAGTGWAAQGDPPTNVPSELKAPADQKLIARLHGVGDQIYVCTAKGDTYAWTLKAPDARLIGSDGKIVGRHFAGPTWEAEDHSSVQAKVDANVASPDPDSVPWLLLHATSHSGQGTMSNVLTIQRLNTDGGKAPAEGCDSAHAGAEGHVAYEADYYFYGSK